MYALFILFILALFLFKRSEGYPHRMITKNPWMEDDRLFLTRF